MKSPTDSNFQNVTMTLLKDSKDSKYIKNYLESYVEFIIFVVFLIENVIDYTPSTARSSCSHIFFKIGVKNFASFTEKYPCCSLFFIKLQPFKSEDTPTQAFSCEICKNFKSNFFLQNTFDYGNTGKRSFGTRKLGKISVFYAAK